MKKRLNPDTIVNELQGASGFFPTREPAATDGDQARPAETPQAQPITDRPAVARPAAPPVRPVLPVRVMKNRHPFDIYQDQLDSLKRLSVEERMQGGLGSMSKMVRDALDAYIAGRRGDADVPYGAYGSRQPSDEAGESGNE